MAEPLVEYLVTLEAAGQDAVNTAVAGVKERLQALDPVIGQFARTFAEAFVAAQQQAARMAQAQRELATVTGMTAERQRQLAQAFSLTAGPLMGFIRSGLQGTAQGELLSLRMQMLSREIANLFLPAINAAVNGLVRLTEWFRSLSGQQQESIARWVAVGTSVLGVSIILPKVAAGFALVGNALTTAFAFNPILALVGVLVGVGLAADNTGELVADLARSFRPLFQAVGEVVRPLLEFAGAVATALAPQIKRLAEILALPVVQWGLLAAGMLAVMPRLVGGVLSLGAAFTTLRGAIAASIPLLMELADLARNISDIGTGPAFLNLAQNAGLAATPPVSRFGTFVPMTAEQRAAAGLPPAPGQGRRELEPRGGGFEGLMETFRRLQAASNRTDDAQRTREEQLGALERIFGTAESILALVRQGVGQQPLGA